MKREKWLAAFLAAAVLLAMLPAAAFARTQPYSITYNLTGMTANGQPETVAHGQVLNIQLTAASGYAGPYSLSITVDGKELIQGTGADYTIIVSSDSDLFFSIFKEAVTGNIVITASATWQNRSSNANLSSLGYQDPGAWQFYTLTAEQLQQAASSAGVSITLSHKCKGDEFLSAYNVKTEHSGAKYAYENQWAKLNNGKGTLVIVVTAEDGVTQKRYTMNFTVDSTHSWGTPTWEWAEDGSSAQARFVCEDDSSHTETLAAQISSTVVNPGCEGNREVLFTATVTLDGTAYTDTKSVVGGMTGHSWGAPVWNWTGNSATVTFACQNDSSHTEHPAVTVSSSTIEPATCVREGRAMYTASTVFNGVTYTDARVVTLPATAHNYAVSVTSPTCTQGGCTIYTCTVCHASYTAEETAARGHHYGEWTFDGESTHSAWCLRDDCQHRGTVDCTRFSWQLLAESANADSAYEFLFCPVCGEVNGVSRLLLAEGRAEALTERLPRGELVLRMGELETGETILSVGFEYGGKPTQPTGQVEITLSAARLEGYALALLEVDGAESELPFAVEESEAVFTLDFTPVEGEEAVPVRVVRLIPIAGAAGIGD